MLQARSQTWSRNELAWYLAGLVVVQLGLAVGIERYWSDVRDPWYADLVRVVRDREAEIPGRPLVLALGSSRTKMGLRAGRLNHPEDGAAPVFVNAAQLGGGPMQQLVLLRRFLDCGIRPGLVFLEMMPMALSDRDGRPIEERVINLSRFSAPEVASMSAYCEQPLRFCWPRALGWLWPCWHYRSALREALRIDAPEAQRPRYVTCDRWGFTLEHAPSADRETATRLTIETHRLALTQPSLSPGALQASRDVLELCRREHIAVVLFLPPENSGFRNYAPDVAACQVRAIRQLAEEFELPLLDARTWIDDEGFSDGHHANPRGAEQYTARFGRDALVPYRHLAEPPPRYARNDRN
jgi:hypothetical protein